MSSRREVFFEFVGNLREVVGFLNSALAPDCALTLESVGSGPDALEFGEGRLGLAWARVLSSDFLEWDDVRGLNYYISVDCCWHEGDTDESYESNCTERARSVMHRLACVLRSRFVLSNNLANVVASLDQKGGPLKGKGTL